MHLRVKRNHKPEYEPPLFGYFLSPVFGWFLKKSKWGVG